MSNFTYKGFDIIWNWNLSSCILTIKCTKLQERAGPRDLVQRNYNDVVLENEFKMDRPLNFPTDIIGCGKTMINNHLSQEKSQ